LRRHYRAACCEILYEVRFVEDVKRNCAREDVMFDNDLFNELVG
jgi:hypothetical protein